MSVHGIRDLSRNTSEVIDEVRSSGEVAVITRNGEAAVALVPLEELEDFVLTQDSIIRDLEKADEEISAGEGILWKDALKMLEE